MLTGLDLRTTAICHIGIVGFVGLVLLFCRAHQKTYPGFDFWVAGSLTAIAGYGAMLARLAGFEVFSILVGNALFMLAAIFRLEATCRFLRGRPAARAIYLLVPLVVGGVSWYYFAQPSISMRNLVISLGGTGVTIGIAWEFLRHQAARRLALYRAIGVLMAAFSFMIFYRAALWCLHPEVGLFGADRFHAPFIFGSILAEAGMGMTFLLLNSQRLEEELARSEQQLSEQLAEIKVLRGMLPICACCKSIHDTDGHWEKIESYVQRHTEAEFSHSICPDCVAKHYPEYAHALGQPSK